MILNPSNQAGKTNAFDSAATATGNYDMGLLVLAKYIYTMETIRRKRGSSN
jgi:hypothetical protein